MIERQISPFFTTLAKSFKAIAVIGPRQSGKTTMVKALLKDKPYVSLENPKTREFAINDPEGFLANYPKGAILDEIQRAPEIFSYLQEILDNSKQKGMFVLTGSNNFLLQEAITQTLAGRIAYINLLPFSCKEVYKKPVTNIDKLLLKGMYPPVHHQKISPVIWSENYIKTYVERDVRQLKNISNLNTFNKFIKILATRNGEELNLQSIGIEAGVDHKTVQSWISLLESSYIIYLLKPYYKNYSKTIVKRPKLYFYDTCLVCSLLGISSEAQLKVHPSKGSLFESFVIIEILKNYTNKGKTANLFYWRDKTGHEIDLIIEDDKKLIPIEIKSGKTIHTDYMKHLTYWLKLTSVKKGYVLYMGKDAQKRSNGIELINWYDYIINMI